MAKAASGKKPRSRKKKAQRSSFRFALLFFFCVAAALTTLIGLHHVLNGRKAPSEAVQAEARPRPARPHEEKAAPPRTAGSARAPLPRIYETPVRDLEQHTKEVDLILLQTMSSFDGGRVALRQGEAEVRLHEGRPYPYQTLYIGIHGQENAFCAALENNLSHLSDTVALRPDRNAENAWAVLISGTPTHRLHFTAVPPPPAPSADAGGRLIVVIDDLGESLHAARILTDIDLPIVFSILPDATHSAEVVRLARAKGKDILLHMPMEPKGYPETANPGPDALFVGMPPPQIAERFRESLRRVPGAIGVNNHMGSRFTEDEAGMSEFLKIVKENRLFFLDSLTSPGSTAKRLCRELRLPYFERTIFLDNVQETSLILHQLRKAEQLAKKYGLAIAIGHPYDQTLEALRHWARQGVGAGTRVLSIREISAPPAASRIPAAGSGLAVSTAGSKY